MLNENNMVKTRDEEQMEREIHKLRETINEQYKILKKTEKIELKLRWSEVIDKEDKKVISELNKLTNWEKLMLYGKQEVETRAINLK